MRERAQRFDSRQNMHRKDFEVFHYEDPKSGGVDVHHHDFYEVYFLLDGQITFWVEGEIYSVNPGDILLINPMILHRPIISLENSVYERMVLWIEKEFLEGISSLNLCLNECFEPANDSAARILHTANSVERAEISSILGKLVRECYTDELGNNLYAKGLFLQFMVELNRLAKRCVTGVERKKEPSSLVSKVLTYINEHYRDELSLEQLSKHFFVSKYYLSHEFSKVVGIGIYRYIILKRLTVAKQLLIDGVPSGEVSSKCGFNDYTSFYRAFKAEYGINPRQFTKI